jgi:hypothetical protein
MSKRVTWFVGGVAAGVAGAGYAKRKVKATASALAPANIAKRTAQKVRNQGHTIVDAVREGRAAMNAREDELKIRRDARVESVDSRLGPGEQLIVDGRPVDTGRVIVLKQKR